MPVIMFTIGEVVQTTLVQARDHAKRIVELADTNQMPLASGESVDARRHKIASLGKKLAETFLMFDETMQALAEQHVAEQAHDVTADAPKDPPKGDGGGLN